MKRITKESHTKEDEEMNVENMYKFLYLKMLQVCASTFSYVLWLFSYPWRQRRKRRLRRQQRHIPLQDKFSHTKAAAVWQRVSLTTAILVAKAAS